MRYNRPTASEIVPGVAADAAVAFGKPVIAGTRTPVALILGQLASGVPEQEIREQYDLTAEQLRAALRYRTWLGDEEVLRATGS